MEQQVLSISQMKHLQEFGLNTSKASMRWWRRIRDFRGEKVEGRWFISINTPRIVQNFEQDEIVPTLTLQDILNILPKTINDDYLLYTLKMEYSTIKDVWDICYWNHRTITKNLFDDKSPLIAAYDLLCWCIENGYVEKQ